MAVALARIAALAAFVRVVPVARFLLLACVVRTCVVRATLAERLVCGVQFAIGVVVVRLTCEHVACVFLLNIACLLLFRSGLAQLVVVRAVVIAIIARVLFFLLFGGAVMPLATTCSSLLLFFRFFFFRRARFFFFGFRKWVVHTCVVSACVPVACHVASVAMTCATAGAPRAVAVHRWYTFLLFGERRVFLFGERCVFLFGERRVFRFGESRFFLLGERRFLFLFRRQ